MLEPEGVVVHVRLEPRRDRSTVTCFRCGEMGHYRAECHVFRTRFCTRRACVDKDCFFAHDASQLRRPWVPRCVRVEKVDGTITVRGCGQTGHTFRMCPHDWRCPRGQLVDTQRTISDDRETTMLS